MVLRIGTLQTSKASYANGGCAAVATVMLDGIGPITLSTGRKAEASNPNGSCALVAFLEIPIISIEQGPPRHVVVLLDDKRIPAADSPEAQQRVPVVPGQVYELQEWYVLLGRIASGYLDGTLFAGVSTLSALEGTSLDGVEYDVGLNLAGKPLTIREFGGLFEWRWQDVILQFTLEEMAAFLIGAKNGEFNIPDELQVELDKQLATAM